MNIEMPEMDVLNERRQVAERLLAIKGEFRDVMTYPRRRSAASRLAQRVWWRISLRWRANRRDELLRDWASTTGRAAAILVGSTGRPWGVLSGGTFGDPWRGCMCLEDTLGSLVRHDDTEVKERASSLLKRLPALRADAELAPDLDLVAVEDDVLGLVTLLANDKEYRRQLLDFIPGDRRPLPTELRDLQRSHPPVTLYVSIPSGYFEEETAIKLNDIVITDGLRGKGLGAATLTELCRFADHLGYPIWGELEPGPSYDEDVIPSLARWYASLGFRQGDREPSQWMRGGTIRRKPTPDGSSRA